MEDESPKDKLAGIVSSGSGAIAKSSASLMGRGLRTLSGWDAARVIEAGKELTSDCRHTIFILMHIKGQLEATLNPPFWCLRLVDEFNELHDRAEFCYETRGTHRIPRIHAIKMGDGLIRQVVENCRSMVITDVQTNAPILAQVKEPQEKQAQSIIAVPLRLDDECIGVLELIDCIGPGGFPQADLSLLESLADFVAIALWNANEFRRLDILANIDEHTGFYNARYLDYWLGIELMASDAKAHTFSLVCVVSELKNLATSLTYAYYTQLLVEVSQKIIEEFIKREDISRAIHSGQGKFYFFLPLDCEKACAVAQRFHRFFRDTVWLQEQGLNARLTASIGVATYPEDGRTKAELLHSLDVALSLVTSSTGDGVAAAKIGILPPV